MIEDGGVQPEGCICEPCSDISTNWRDMRSGFGYKLLAKIFLLPSRFTTFPKTLLVSAFVKSDKNETQTITS